MSKRTCETCRWWNEPAGPPVSDTTREGFCRRYPPSVSPELDEPEFRYWPLTEAWDWCGEWAPLDVLPLTFGAYVAGEGWVSGKEPSDDGGER